MNEINKDGELIRLTSTKPRPRAPPVVIEKEEIADKQELTQPEVFTQLEIYVGAEVAEQVRLFAEDPSAKFTAETAVISDKATRTDIHAFFKTHYPGIFKTEANDGKIVINKSNGKVDYRESGIIQVDLNF